MPEGKNRRPDRHVTWVVRWEPEPRPSPRALARALGRLAAWLRRQDGPAQR